ncbi:MAG: MmcQ/YjbR family DNA-binding protein [Deltaproteobacteria bacterium]|nr:MmcQ/YjbR family DNA-binding protein [Deltaproteobacteria bacterium]MCW5802613.1 MmcQ/YjbR family DNA-binding protein [Deltaproteobacteria bacterium]
MREFCATLPGSDEKLSHGAPTWFVKQGVYAHFCDDHHGDGRIALWCAAPEGAQAMLVESEPAHYFIPAYVGHLGWVGVRLDRDAAWSQVTAILEAAHATRSAPRPKSRKSR